MSASDEATLQKSFAGSKSSPRFTLKTKLYHSFGCCDDSQSCEQLKKHVTDKYFEKKVRLGTIITFCYMKRILALQYLSYWCLYGAYV